MDHHRQAVWDAEQYARFRSERARPFFELLERVPRVEIRAIADLGCGDGALTKSLLDRWPDAEIWGIDSSAEMLAGAPSGNVLHFELLDLRAWKPPVPLDLVVSNAALHWVPDHAAVLRQCAGWLTPGGALAVQMPNNRAETAYRCVSDLLHEPAWSGRLRGIDWDAVVEPPAFYADVLGTLGFRSDVWETTYYHPLAGATEIVEWMKGTTLRPILTALGEDEGARFLAELAARVAPRYARGQEGVLFPFRRLFFVATRL